MNKFKVGDTVWIKAAVVKSDERDDTFPYKVELAIGDSFSGGLWVSESALHQAPSTQSVVEEVFDATQEKMKLHHNQSL